MALAHDCPASPDCLVSSDRLRLAVDNPRELNMLANSLRTAMHRSAYIQQDGPRVYKWGSNTRLSSSRSYVRHPPLTMAASGAVPLSLGGNWVATGVPLIESFAALSLREAALRSVTLLGLTAAGVVLGQKVIDIAEKKMSQWVTNTDQSAGLDLLAKTAVIALDKPAKSILPLWGANFALLVMASLIEVAIEKLDVQAYERFHAFAGQALGAHKMFAQMLQDSTELLAIAFVAWFLFNWKNRFITTLIARLSSTNGNDEGLPRILVPLSGLLSWVIVGLSISFSLSAMGINVQALLALGSISSLVLGFAAQSTISNVVTAVTLYMTRPFIKGDRIQLKSMSGATIVSGVVERIMPMRTMIRTDAKFPVYIPNKDVANLMIVNESQLRRVSVTPPVPLLDAEMVVRYPEDVDKLDAIEQAVTAYINSCEEIEGGSGRCTLSSFNEKGAVLQIKAVIKHSLASKSAHIRAKILKASEKIVRQMGAYLFVHQPPALSSGGYSSS